VLASIVATEASTVALLSAPGLDHAADRNLAFLQLTLGRSLVAWLLSQSM
jgi:hypothetical protein